MTVLENEHLREAAGLWRLYFESGRWAGAVLADGMTAIGRGRPLGMRSRKQPLAVREDVATDPYRTECPMSTIGHETTVNLTSES